MSRGAQRDHEIAVVDAGETASHELLGDRLRVSREGDLHDLDLVTETTELGDEGVPQSSCGLFGARDVSGGDDDLHCGRQAGPTAADEDDAPDLDELDAFEGMGREETAEGPRLVGADAAENPFEVIQVRVSRIDGQAMRIRPSGRNRDADSATISSTSSGVSSGPARSTWTPPRAPAGASAR